jgi:hypothetical protein
MNTLRAVARRAEAWANCPSPPQGRDLTDARGVVVERLIPRVAARPLFGHYLGKIFQRSQCLPQLVAFGPAHDAAIKSAFRHDMAGEDFSGWLYNGPGGEFGVGDLGYYVGYAIVGRYYNLSPDKTEAIRTLIELDYGDQAAIETLVAASGYFDE